jgi:gamma-glutamyltranspeptidase/glutathione hydrolase
MSIAAASADARATQAAIDIMLAGGNAVDAAIAANAVLAVTCPHLCGIGGDLLSVIADDAGVYALNSSGRAGSGTSAEHLRAQGFTEIPLRHHMSAVTVPGCVDGWVTAHERFGRLELAEIFEAAITLADGGFIAHVPLSTVVKGIDEQGRRNLHEIVNQAHSPDAVITRPAMARTLSSIAGGGRSAFYEGEFGKGLIELGQGLFSPEDLAAVQSEWVTPLQESLLGVEIFTVPPNSQGYLALGSAWLGAHINLPADPTDADWAHLLIEASTAAGHDRPEVLSESADGVELLAQIRTRLGMVNPTSASPRPSPHRQGDTTYLCTMDHEGQSVSLIQSNAAGFGSWIVEPNTQIPLHNRGLGFNLIPGHPAEMTPGARPPHTLSPLMILGPGLMRGPLGTMGGDAQPQILLQILMRMLRSGQGPDAAVNSPRWVLRGPSTGFDTWTGQVAASVVVENTTDRSSEQIWAPGLSAKGHQVVIGAPMSGEFGHAHAILRSEDGTVSAGADHRTVIGSAQVVSYPAN